MQQPIRESGFLEARGGAVYFLGRWPDAETWCVVSRDGEGGSFASTRTEADAKALWDACVTGAKCVECAAPLALGRCLSGWEQREADGVCHSCDFWRGLVSGGPNVAVIGGFRYSIAPDAPKGFRGFIGHGGAEFVIRFTDGREVITHNLWANGRVPPHFVGRIPDNATFVKAARAGGYIGSGSAVGIREA